ncbi:uncharacterized protein [Coffea arabica]|uniref:ATP-dependent DNA helicase n=1 Tax=Coffea arabica TaxID=13443 RepID=A0A6P6TBR7_COFAR|nr:uncharacterized protein LOC113699754 [Coffea arabica]
MVREEKGHRETGGMGKTFLYRVLLAFLRSQGYVAIAVATSGVAAPIISGGRTDEASMEKTETIEAVHCLLTDIMEFDVPFGGKTIIFGSDFPQTLPVIEQLGESESIKSTVLYSHLWSHMRKQRLATNMKAALDAAFSDFFIRVGEDVEPVDEHGQMSLPPHMVISYHNKEELLDRLFGIVFPDLNMYSCNPYRMINRCGQTLDYVEIYLSKPVFFHGQLCVALSRVRNSSAVKALIASEWNMLSQSKTSYQALKAGLAKSLCNKNSR